MFQNLILLTFIVFTCFQCAVGADFHPLLEDDIDIWLSNKTQVANQMIYNSISMKDAAPGAVVASTQVTPPVYVHFFISQSYYYHWVRDSAITMNYLIGLYTSGTLSYLFSFLIII